jgi:hypothetical protein
MVRYLETPREQGRRARKSGGPLDSNPQRVEPFISEWAAGWREQDERELDKMAREIEREAKRVNGERKRRS